MSLRLIAAVVETENADEFHLGRLLVLIRSLDLRRRTIATKARAVEGIMKLAKLDFFLRYPTCLERAFRRLGKPDAVLAIEGRERISIETKMIRFRYGPWDARYRRWLGLLSARGLVILALDGKTVTIGLTDRGRELADQFRAEPLFAAIVARGDAIADALGTMPATRLKDFVYDVIPELLDLRWGEEIEA
jgi:hypothetical protein